MLACRRWCTRTSHDWRADSLLGQLPGKQARMHSPPPTPPCPTPPHPSHAPRQIESEFRACLTQTGPKINSIYREGVVAVCCRCAQPRRGSQNTLTKHTYHCGSLSLCCGEAAETPEAAHILKLPHGWTPGGIRFNFRGNPGGIRGESRGNPF